MKLSEKIAELQEALAEHGDINVVYASDEEGNSYHPSNRGGSLYALTEDGELPYYVEVVDEEELEERDEESDIVIVYCIN